MIARWFRRMMDLIKLGVPRGWMPASLDDEIDNRIFDQERIVRATTSRMSILNRQAAATRARVRHERHRH